MGKSDRRRILEDVRPEPEIAFTREEFGARLTRLKTAMAQAGVQAMFLSSPESLYYISGFRAEWYQAFGPKAWLPASGIAVHVDCDDFIHFEVENEQVLAGFTSISTDLRILPEAAQPMDGMKEFIVTELAAAGWLKGTIGLEMSSYRPNRAYSEEFQAALEERGATVVNGSDIIAAVRRSKSAQENCLHPRGGPDRRYRIPGRVGFYPAGRNGARGLRRDHQGHGQGGRGKSLDHHSGFLRRKIRLHARAGLPQEDPARRFRQHRPLRRL